MQATCRSSSPRDAIVVQDDVDVDVVVAVVAVVVRWLRVVARGVVATVVVLEVRLVGVGDVVATRRLPQRHSTSPPSTTDTMHKVGLPHMVRLPRALPFHARCITARMALLERSSSLARSPAKVNGARAATAFPARLSVIRSSPSKHPGSKEVIELFCNSSELAWKQEQEQR